MINKENLVGELLLVEEMVERPALNHPLEIQKKIHDPSMIP